MPLLIQLDLFLPFLTCDGTDFANWNRVCKYSEQMISKHLSFFKFVVQCDKLDVLPIGIKQLHLKKIPWHVTKNRFRLQQYDISKLEKMKLHTLSIDSDVFADSLVFHPLTSIKEFQYSNGYYWQRTAAGTVCPSNDNMKELIPKNVKRLRFNDSAFEKVDFRSLLKLQTLILDTCEIEKLYLPENMQHLVLHNTVLNLKLNKMPHLETLSISNPGFFDIRLNDIANVGTFGRRCNLVISNTLQKLTLGQGIHSIKFEPNPVFYPDLQYLSLDHFDYLAQLPSCPFVKTIQLDEKRGHQRIHSAVVEKLLLIVMPNGDECVLETVDVTLQQTKNLKQICELLAKAEILHFKMTCSHYSIPLNMLYALPFLQTLDLELHITKERKKEFEIFTRLSNITSIKIRDVKQQLYLAPPFYGTTVTKYQHGNNILWKQWNWERKKI